MLAPDSPNYAMELVGALKDLFDHRAYRWIAHRQYGGMFGKVGVVLALPAGAPAGHTTRSMAKQLKWLRVPKVYRFGLICGAVSGQPHSTLSAQYHFVYLLWDMSMKDGNICEY